MPEITTARNMRMDVRHFLGSSAVEFDVAAIVDDIQRDHGTVDIDTLNNVYFWRVVMRHEVNDARPVIEPELYCGAPSRFYLAPCGGQRQQVTKADWVAAEQGAGFRGGRNGEPSTGGFGNGSISGSIETVKD